MNQPDPTPQLFNPDSDDPMEPAATGSSNLQSGASDIVSTFELSFSGIAGSTEFGACILCTKMRLTISNLIQANDNVALSAAIASQVVDRVTVNLNKRVEEQVVAHLQRKTEGSGSCTRGGNDIPMRNVEDYDEEKPTKQNILPPKHQLNVHIEFHHYCCKGFAEACFIAFDPNIFEGKEDLGSELSRRDFGTPVV
ncbi:hypothetical protein NP233_g10832 [Leucocoprinus birnbaumii]|uniref:Uncharacterized protein n=1 Tax=Leucocoprinus birnbaumii TaxID=56174 RepID=A0AAD5VJM1_9AGAR|nr:hypothetical protein NP233_g10832 [Leucocoprinus birnbaumii]